MPENRINLFRIISMAGELFDKYKLKVPKRKGMNQIVLINPAGLQAQVEGRDS